MIYSGLEEHSDLLVQIMISRGLNIDGGIFKGHVRRWCQVLKTHGKRYPEITGGHTGNLFCLCNSRKYYEAVPRLL